MSSTIARPIASQDLSGHKLEGVNVYGPDDNHIGDIVEVHGSGHTGQAIVDVGGFLGLGAKRVSLPVSELNFMQKDDGDVHANTRMTKDQLKDMPEYNS